MSISTPFDLRDAEHRIETAHRPWLLLGAPNTSAFALTAPGPDDEMPVSADSNGSYVIEMRNDRFMRLALFGEGDANEDKFPADVYGWGPLNDDGAKWYPHRLLGLANCELGGQTGLDGLTTLTDDVHFVDRIGTVTDLTYKQSARFFGHRVNGNGIPFIAFNANGFPLIEVRTTRGGGGSTNPTKVGGMYSTW